MPVPINLIQRIIVGLDYNALILLWPQPETLQLHLAS